MTVMGWVEVGVRQLGNEEALSRRRLCYIKRLQRQNILNAT